MTDRLNTRIWFKGAAAAAISGGANGIVTGFAAIGIDPGHFNLASGIGHTFAIGGVAAALSAILGVSLYLRQSPLPSSWNVDESSGNNAAPKTSLENKTEIEGLIGHSGSRERNEQR